MSYPDPLADWLAAERQHHQLIAEDAYFRWIDRGRPFGDSWRDWFAAEAASGSGRTTQGRLSDDLVRERLLRELIAEAAYFRWIDRGRPLGDSWNDWSAAEAQFNGAANRFWR